MEIQQSNTSTRSGNGTCGVLQGRYELGRVLGRGTFGKVHVARDLCTGRLVAMKIVSKAKVMKAGMNEQIKREISAMKLVSHPNIVELHEVMANKDKIFLAMELVRGGAFCRRLARSGGKLSDNSARRYFRQLISALRFCHSRGVYHRDLKLENLLIDDNRDFLKIADFGLSSLANEGRKLCNTTCGTPAYVAPEIVMKKAYDGAKSDIWSCGVILYTLLAGTLPFQADNVMIMYKKIVRGEFKFPNWVSLDARKVISRLLDPNPDTRITIDELAEMPWFKKPVISKQLPIPAPVMVDEFENRGKNNEPEKLNAFHLISLSEGFDLSPLFDCDRREDGMRFATREPAEKVISRLEMVAAKAAGRIKVTKSSAVGVRLEGDDDKGMKGKLSVAADIVAVAPSLAVVEVRMDGGDTIEYQRFCRDELKPALKDIFWASAADCHPMATA